MVGQRAEHHQQDPVIPERSTLIERGFADVVTLAAPPPWWLDKDRLWQPTDAAEVRTCEQPPKRERDGLI
jgi:hypothetical protein